MRGVCLIASLLTWSIVATAGPGLDVTAQVLVVPPYLETIVFDISCEAGDGTVAVFPPGSPTPVREGIDGVEAVRVGSMLTTFVVTRPQPGHWVIRTARPGSRVRIRSQQFFPRGVLLQPDATIAVRAPDPVHLAYRVLDGADRPIEELRGHPLSLDVTVTAPDGTKHSLPMKRDASPGPATFRSTAGVHCDRPGRYATDVRVITVDSDGHPLDVFRDRWSGFTVRESEARMQTLVRPVPLVVHHVPLLLLIVAATVVALAAGAILRRRKTKAVPPCLSHRRRQD